MTLMRLLSLLFFVSISQCCHAGILSSVPWSEQDKNLEYTFQAVHLVEWAQMREAAAHPEKYQYVNWGDAAENLWGEYPRMKRVDRYFLLTNLGHVLITDLLPSEARPYFQWATIAWASWEVYNNNQVGIKISFNFPFKS